MGCSACREEGHTIRKCPTPTIKVVKLKELEKSCRDAKPDQLVIVQVWIPTCEHCIALSPEYLACSKKFSSHQFFRISATKNSDKLLLFYHAQKVVSTVGPRKQRLTEHTLSKHIEQLQLKHCSVVGPVDQTINQPDIQPISSPYNQPMSQPINQSIDQPIIPSIQANDAPATRQQPPHKRTKTDPSMNAAVSQIIHKRGTRADHIALVIGNSKYEQTPLTNPVNDAHDISEALHSKLGFDVTTGYDLSFVDMKDLINKFASKIVPHKTTCFVFFCGHGVQVDGTNYLLPVDNGKFESDADIRHYSVKADWMLDKIKERSPLVSILVFDACRSTIQWYRGASSGGLAPMQMHGSIIAYSCKPGTHAVDSSDNRRNSTFTKYLLANIEAELDFAIMFRSVVDGVYKETNGQQHPSLESDLRKQFVSLSLASQPKNL